MFDYNFHWRPVLKSLPDLLEAGLLTLEVATLSMVIGIVVGLALALIRLKLKGPLYWLATTWVELARNTPALFQLFFFGFGLGAFGIHLTPFSSYLPGSASTVPAIWRRIFAAAFRLCPRLSCGRHGRWE